MFRPELISFLALLGRSPDSGEGWRAYSERLSATLVEKHVKMFPGIFEVDGSKVRTVGEGNVLVKWMNYVPPKA